MFNKEKAIREVILYKLLPYSSDVDFNLAVSQGRVDNKIFEFQTRFSYWIAVFESIYGNIATFWMETNGNESEKIILLNNLINNLIQVQNGKEANT